MSSSITIGQPIAHLPYQEDVPGLTLELLRLSQVFAPPATRPEPSPPTRLDFYQLLLITEGQGSYLVDFHEYSVRPGTVFAVGKGQVQQFAPDFRGEGWLLAFTEKMLAPDGMGLPAWCHLRLFQDALVRPDLVLTPLQVAAVEQLLQLLQAEYANPVRDDLQEGLLRSGLQIVLLTLERYKRLTVPPDESGLYREPFLQFKELVETHCLTTRRVDEYARMLGFSTKKLTYVTQHVVGQTAKQFITASFLLQSKRLLVSTDLSIKEVAHQAGFDEPTNFIKFFKKHSGQLPLHFKKTHR